MDEVGIDVCKHVAQHLGDSFGDMHTGIALVLVLQLRQVTLVHPRALLEVIQRQPQFLPDLPHTLTETHGNPPLSPTTIPQGFVFANSGCTSIRMGL